VIKLTATVSLLSFIRPLFPKVTLGLFLRRRQYLTWQ